MGFAGSPGHVLGGPVARLPRLDEIDSLDPLLMDEDELLEMAFQMLDDELVLEGRTPCSNLRDFGDVELEPEPLDFEQSGLECTGTLYRFSSDEAIEEYCLQNYLDNPVIQKDGRVTAWCVYTNRTVHIGWTY